MSPTDPDVRPEPRRQALAPGLRVVPRGRDHLQVGIGLGPHLRLRDDRATRAALARLSDPRITVEETPAVAAVLSALAEAGCLVDRDDAARIRRRRAGARLAILGPLHSLGAELASSAGLRVRRSVPAARAVLVTSVVELDRTLTDPLVRRGQAHLPLRLVDGVAAIGPFVSPGRTACLRCVDLHACEQDPDYPVLVDRYAQTDAHADPRTEPDDAEDLADLALAAQATAWAIAELATFLGGERPSLWSRYVVLRPGRDPQLHQVHPHPACGCGWP